MRDGKKQAEFIEFLMENDLQFYEKFLVNLSEEELKLFLENNPDFLITQKKNPE